MKARRVVVKLGSGVLSGGKDRLDAKTIRRLAAEIAEFSGEGHEAIVVSSGAILAGREKLGLKARPATTQLKQAAAAVGQSRLMRAWEESFGRERKTVAQVLLTREDMRHRGRYINARNTIFTLLRLGAVPVINENDTVADEEIKFGDNDVLSALVAGLCDAQLLVLLTDQDGLYTADPRTDPKAELISVVGEGRAEVKLGKAGPSGSGGMGSKVEAARMAASAGVEAVIANGFKPGTLRRVLAGEAVGTRFSPRPSPLGKRKAWLAFASNPKGAIHVDAGARQALVEGGKSLLPSGVKSLSKAFAAGDVVSLVEGGVEFARGLSNYAAADLQRIKGLRTAQIEQVLGQKTADEVVHRDNLAVL
jgi:glutamate 5-kinase